MSTKPRAIPANKLPAVVVEAWQLLKKFGFVPVRRSDGGIDFLQRDAYLHAAERGLIQSESRHG